MTQPVQVKIKGLNKLLEALRNNANLGQPVSQAFHKIGLRQVSDSRRKAPVDVGKLRNSIFYEVEYKPFPTYVRAGVLGGPTAAYAAYMEFGTGTQHDHPNWPKKEHKLPSGVLEGWVARKGRYRGEKAKARRARLARVKSSAFLAARGIMQRGGLTPRRYLRDPFEANKETYIRYLRKALREGSLDGKR